MKLFGLENVKGLGFLQNLDLMGVSGAVQKFVILILLCAIIAGMVAYYFYKVKNKKIYNKKLFFFEEVNGQMVPVEDYYACELTIPNSDIKVFYNKNMDLYMPRPVKKMGKDSYWFCIRNNREIVNFTMTNLNEEMKEAGSDFDHTDMRYAWVNLKELIKRNYRDKANPWWREYKDVIATVVFIFVMSIAMYFLLHRIGTLIGQVGDMIAQTKQLIDIAGVKAGSGVVMA